jgi:hypothetical protein
VWGMGFYETGAQARVFQATRDALIALIGKAVTFAMKRGRIAPAETPQLIGWTIFCIYQVELRRWLSDGNLDLRKGMNRLRRTLKVCVTGLERSRAPAPFQRARREPRPRAAARARR